MPGQQPFAIEAAQRLNTIVQDPRFLTWVRQATYSATGRLRLTADRRSRQESSEVVAELIRLGLELVERYPEPESIDLDIVLTDLKQSMSAVTDPFGRSISTDIDFFTDCQRQDDPLTLAAAWMHEWMHLAGFIHALAQRRDPLDVPNVVEFLVLELGRAPEAPRAA